MFIHLNRQQNDITRLKECLDRAEMRVRALELKNESMVVGMDSMLDRLCFCCHSEGGIQVGHPIETQLISLMVCSYRPLKKSLHRLVKKTWSWSMPRRC